MERFLCCLLLVVAMAATLASATYSRYPMMGTGYGWGYRLGHPVMGMGLNLGGYGIGHRRFGFPVSPFSFGFGYRPLSYGYNPGFGLGLGLGFGGYNSRLNSRYGMRGLGGFGRYSSFYDDTDDLFDDRDDDDRFWPYSGIDDWNLDGFDSLRR